MRWDILDAVQQAAAELGIPPVEDFNGGDNFGSSYFQVNQRGGRRWSAARGFLKPALNRSNLKLETGARVRRILVEEGRAAGVEYDLGDGPRVARAGEVILSAGAIGSPALLQLSGIGPGALLQDLGIAAVADLPGVGANLQDHLQLRPVYKVEGARTLNVEYRSLWRRGLMAAQYAIARRGPMTMAPSQLGIFAKSSPRFERANVQFHIQPLSLPKFGEAMHDFPAITVSVCNLRPTSRGSVRLASPDPAAAPKIAPHYLSTEEDKQVAVESLRLARRLMAQPALRRYRPEEFLPGPSAEDDQALRDAAARIGTTIFHPVGTVKMGIEGDPMAVLDERLRVRGVGSLRVADASVMPTITSGNTNSPTIMIAEKAAEMILGDAR
jgi:choline dehydrogenase-like flavoprotein